MRVPRPVDWRWPSLAVIAAGVLLLCSSISWATFLEALGSAPSANAQVAVTSGRLLGASRFQLAWLNWDAPRPVFLTALANPAVARDVGGPARQDSLADDSAASPWSIRWSICQSSCHPRLPGWRCY